MSFSRGLSIAMASLLVLGAVAVAADKKDKDVPAVLDFEMESLEGEEVNLADYEGKVLLIVNVASKCGATPQYEALEDLNRKYKDKGLVVLGFPCNQFGKQEPGTAKEIREFCESTYDVTFDMFAKIDVNGEDAAPLYKYLTSEETNPEHAGKINWNFEKFLISRDGEVVARFKTAIAPDTEDVVQAIEEELEKE